MAVDDSPDKEIADVITERKDHLQAVAERLTKFAKNVIVLKGGMGAKQTPSGDRGTGDRADGEERVTLATGRYLGGASMTRASTRCFSRCRYPGAGPSHNISGRLHRLHAAKREVVIYDYVDVAEPLLAKTTGRRDAGYRALGL